MSSKAASVPAPRATTPRVLVYVAEPRPHQLEPGAAPDPPPLAPEPAPPPGLRHRLHDTHLPLPHHNNTLYRTHIEQHEQRHPQNTIYYKPLNEENKVNAYEAHDNTTVHRTDYFAISQQFPKDQIEENRVNEQLVKVKRDCDNQLSGGFSSDSYRIPLERHQQDIASYQVRCPSSVSDSIMPSMQSVSLCHGQNQFENCTIQSGDQIHCNDSDLGVGKNFVNYQFLEQSISHQSIVNQSISILNQQVGVNRGIVGDGESGSTPQLVRTANGVVLAVLPSPVVNNTTDNQEFSSRSVQSDPLQTITVPLGWRRIVNGASVLYVSPSGTALSTLPQLRDYLQTTGTCKCGLPCPLRPETTFSFDPKVIGKPYQPASGAELTKLCNHKRKLLATLQARAQSPGTTPPPIDHKKVPTTEVGVLKKKMKKRPGFPPNMSVSQMMVQRDRNINEFKPQDTDNKRTMSPGVGVRGNNQQQCLQTFTSTPLPPDADPKKDIHVQRASHYLTVNSGWITQQQENVELQKSTLPNNINMGMPVLGTNGQIIGVNTGYNKQMNVRNMNMIPQNNPIGQELKEEKKINPAHQNVSIKQPIKEEESQIFCGLNQPLTPEVMQKINEQQHIFIQQNQKQIEMAMKGFRTQLETNQNKPQGQNQFVPQGQLVIQNGAVVKTNPAKTPPWQVKRHENAITSPSPKPHNNIDFEESNTNISEDSSGSYSPFPNNDQAMCSRVPPLPQHYNVIGQQWPNADANKKKTKAKSGRKKPNIIDNKVMTFGSNGVRILDCKTNTCDDMSNINIPSFMDDPSGYLAQQTVLLNNTISRQVGINSSFDSNQFENINYNHQHMADKNKQTKQCELPMYRNNMVPNPSPSPNNTPDSSVLAEKAMEGPISVCCKGCNVTMKNNTEFSDNQMRLKYMKPNVYKVEMEGNLNTSSPRQGFEDKSVTSSTYLDRSSIGNDNCGPIQAGTVSTSNVSPPEALPPEPSPTLSNSSRNTDTPHSNGSNSQFNCTYPIPSPGYSRENFNSNPSTPCSSNQTYLYNSPGPPNNQSLSGTQMMHFISNHNVNKNLMEVDNISMVGVKPVLKPSQEGFRADSRKRLENSMPGYCPPPHMGGGPAHSLIQTCYVQTFVTTMASGFSVTRDTVTSVLAGKANTATTSINASHANFIRPSPPPSVNLATTYAIPNNQPDPFINSVNLPTSYPLHIAGTTARNMISKTPQEMVQNMVGSPPSKAEINNMQTATIAVSGRKTGAATPGQILISSTGQIIVSNGSMLPPPPKTSTISAMQGSSSVTNVTTSMTQVIPAVGNVQPIVNQSTVVMNTLPAPFVIQPSMMTVDGQVMQQNTVLPQIVTGVVSGQSNDSARAIDVKNGHGFVQGVTMISPEGLKKRGKKKKSPNTSITNVLQITAPQHNSNNIMVHSSPQQNTSPQFSPRGFQLSPNNNISPTPMLQALTIVPGKSGAPAHIVMNGQGSTSNFGSQQIITNTSPSQQINLLQPVNLINNASSVVSNFPAFQQFILPNLGGMVMTADGTAIIQDSSTGMPVQLQLQTVNGQNVLTPVQSSGVFTTGGNGGVVIRAQNQQGKIIQSQHSPGAQFLSPNSQVMMNSPNFNGQLSPLLANLSPTNLTFSTSPHQVRSGNVQAQEFIQTNQMGQTLMVPLSPKQVPIASVTNARTNSTFVQQNTTIVQQQTTLVSNSNTTQMSPIFSNIQGGNSTRLSIDPNLLLTKQIISQKGRFVEMPSENQEENEDQNAMFIESEVKLDNGEGYMKFVNEFPMLGQGGLSGHVRHSVSTQTLVNQQRGRSPSGQAQTQTQAQAVSGSSPPDTTTHSPRAAPEPAAPPASPPAPHTTPVQGNYADTTTTSPEPADVSASGMVQCVSSSQQDMAESRDLGWRAPRNDFHDTDSQNIMPNIPMMRQNRTPNPMETTDMHYNHQNNSMNNQSLMPPKYFERNQIYKRKNEFNDSPTYRTDKIMRTNNGMVRGMPKDNEYDPVTLGMQDKTQARHFPLSGPSSDAQTMQKVFDRHNLGSGNDAKSGDESDEKSETTEKTVRKFAAEDLVWGPVKGYPSWPGKLERRDQDGKWRVKWFGGDKAPGHVEDTRLLTLSEGLEAHHEARTKHRKSRKLNTHLENAIQEAMAELDKKSEKTKHSESDNFTQEAKDGEPISETPKRPKKLDKVKKDKHFKKSTVKIAIPNKPTDGARLRSAR